MFTIKKNNLCLYTNIQLNIIHLVHGSRFFSKGRFIQFADFMGTVLAIDGIYIKTKTHKVKSFL